MKHTERWFSGGEQVKPLSCKSTGSWRNWCGATVVAGSAEDSGAGGSWARSHACSGRAGDALPRGRRGDFYLISQNLRFL